MTAGLPWEGVGRELDPYQRLREHAESRKKMTKAQLLEDAVMADDAYINMAAEQQMAEVYWKDLDAHLKAVHGCEHDIYADEAIAALSSPETTPALNAGLDVEAPEGYTPWVGLMEEAARALGASRSKNKHGQLCPVWARRTVNRGLAPTIEQCDCWILRDARFDAAIVLRAALSQ